jgi:hypothetical protein
MKIDAKRTKISQEHVTIIGFYPLAEVNTDRDRVRYETHYGTLSYSYGIGSQVVFEPEEAIITGDRAIVVIEEYIEGVVDSVELGDFEHPKNAIYISGCSRYSHPSNYFTNFTHKVHIATRYPEYPLYGDQVLAMAIFDRVNKQR